MADAPDDLEQHAMRMPRRNLTAESLRGALEELWERVRSDFKAAYERTRTSVMIPLDAVRLRFPPSLMDRKKGMFSMRGNRLAMRYIRSRAMQDEELEVKYRLLGVHVFWDEDCGGRVYFRCGEEFHPLLEAAIAADISNCNESGLSIYEVDRPDSRRLLDRDALRRIESQLGFKVNVELGKNESVICTWDRPADYPPPEHPSWDSTH
jgi:hypothetical protein